VAVPHDRTIDAVGAVLPFGAQTLTIAAGAVWLRHWLTLAEQRALVEQCRAIMDGPGGGYVPTVRGGGKMHVRMACLGRHWNPMTYRYEASRSDHDNLPVAPVPGEWVALASRAAAAAGFDVQPDIALINFYDGGGRMGLHQDKDESADSIASGAPVVSFSLGDTARFLFGGLKRRDQVDALLLGSGDVFVFGGDARLRYHGVTRILPGTAPAALELSGRFNITFRRY
jgi:alkylated DNA repair protein (DNA oxidative demethylase)